MIKAFFHGRGPHSHGFDGYDIWKAVEQIRAMFAVIMVSTVGSLGMILWGVLSKKVGL